MGEKELFGYRVVVGLSIALAMTMASLTGGMTLPANAAGFSNPAPIAFVANAAGAPSSISVSGLGTSITDVNVTLEGLSHTDPVYADIVLEGPSGAKVMLMSDVPAGEGFCRADVTNLNLTFDDAANNGVPSNQNLAAGTYKPTDNDAVPEESCGLADDPAEPTSSALAAFNGTNPNGDWTLRVFSDCCATPTGTIANGWSLEITATAPPAATTQTCRRLPATILGTDESDVITGTPGRDVIVGLAGNDSIKGLGGNDVICGGEGDDTLRGNRGNDRLRAGGGSDDICRGGAGTDAAAGCEFTRSIP